MSMADNKTDWFETFVAIGIAIVTVWGALLAARATILNDEANNADQTGISSSVDAALARAGGQAALDNNLIAFLDFARHRRMAELLQADLEAYARDPEAYEAARLEMHAEWNRASNSRQFFSIDYYDKFTHRFDQDGFLAGSFAEAASRRNLDPEPLFATAQANRAHAAKLVGVVAVLSLALLSYTLAQVLPRWLGYGFAALGSVVLLLSLVAALLIEAGLV